MDRKKFKRGGAALVAAAAAVSFGSDFLGKSVAHAAVGSATYSSSFEETTTYVTTSFEASGNTANSFPAFGAVAFSSGSFSSLASSGVSASATLTATEYTSAATSTAATHAGSVIDIYFAEAPETPASGSTAYPYDQSNEPGGFDAGTFDADLVGTVTYANVANQVDAIPVTLSTSDVNYIDSVLSGATTGTFEFFTVATTAGGAARYDGSYTGGPATLTLNAAAAVPEPTSALVLGSTVAPLLLSRRRSKRRGIDASA